MLRRALTLIKQNKNLFSNKFPSFQEVKMPALSPTMSSGKIVEWDIKEGQELVPGDKIADLETDKATMEFENQEEGFIAKILEPEGEQLDVGTTLFILIEDEEDLGKFKGFTKDDLKGNLGQDTVEEVKEEVVETQSTVEKGQSVEREESEDLDRLFISPRARSILKEKNMDAKNLNLKGSGPNNRIIAQDVENLQKEEKVQKKPEKKVSKPSQTLETNLYDELEVSTMRKIIADRLTESKRDIPHYYLESEIKMDNLLKFKKQIFLETSQKLSINDFIIKAVSKACLQVPETNSYYLGSKIQRFHNCDVSFAVDIGDGLITPIIKNANQKSLSQINENTKQLVEKARNKQLTPNDYQGGTFTISNLGTMGVKNFSAVINPPQACILAIGSTEMKGVYCEETEGVRWVRCMGVTLSCDHRVVDGAVGAKWLKVFKECLENPMNLVV